MLAVATKADTEDLEGSDLTLFNFRGRTGKAGLEKTFDHILRGEDGYDIWIVNPMGSRFERIDRKAAQKGKSVQLSLDRDLQKIAEDSIERMVRTVAKRRILPDSNWEKTIKRRTEKALTGSDETEVRAELLIGAFKDAPFPLSENKHQPWQDSKAQSMMPRNFSVCSTPKVFFKNRPEFPSLPTGSSSPSSRSCGAHRSSIRSDPYPGQ